MSCGDILNLSTSSVSLKILCRTTNGKEILFSLENDFSIRNLAGCNGRVKTRYQGRILGSYSEQPSISKILERFFFDF